MTSQTAEAGRDFSHWRGARLSEIEAALGVFLPASTMSPQRLHEAMRYACLVGGKRIRPLLCHAAGSVFDADVGAIHAMASAVEFIHVYSLVHDDMPEMDNDTVRRGHPTCHVAFDTATALLVGDALQSLAFSVAASAQPKLDPTRHLQMLHLLAEAAGSSGMAGGQAVDIASIGKPLTIAELEYMHIRKTGALIRASILLGAYCGHATPEELTALTHFANRLGLLFQVIDDILDAESDTLALGKTAGKDHAANKPTYHSLLGASGARATAQQLHDEAQTALEPFGQRALRLRQLTDYVSERRH